MEEGLPIYKHQKKKKDKLPDDYQRAGVVTQPLCLLVADVSESGIAFTSKGEAEFYA